ncbi:hypothetical protein EG240_16275 [Paenimyroides tangerinum]|uniref:Uncharacterized protein n=1 Tax=Paenimyroides tangerinum TaxID=2488728 RepID=A0A3P3VUV5_9FLAO|nr:hypothetical protein [Paenimyroides tangerinum]RRJ86234.1 hypothetical protein EG240_16275 [Paenimyroides tangerinum]
MKHKLLILTFFILLSGLAFGQDTLKVKNHIEGVVLPPMTGEPGKVNKDLVLIRKHNTYVLSQQEKDSVWNSIYTNAITQNLLKDDPAIVKDNWYLPEHTQNLLAVLNVGTLSYNEKSEVLIKRIYADKERELVRVYGGGRSPYSVKTDTIHSKELALQSFLNRQLNPDVNLSKSVSGIISLEFDFTLNQPIRANVYKYNSSSLKKIVRIIKRTKIERIDLSGGIENHPPNTLILYYKKK